MKKKTKIMLEYLFAFVIVASISTPFIIDYIKQNSVDPDNPTDPTDPEDPHGGYSWETDPNRLNLPESRENLTLKIDYNNGTIEIFEGIDLVDHYTSAFDLLNACSVVDYDIYWWSQTSFLVTGINNLSGDWVYDINDNYVPVATNLVSPMNNSIVNWYFQQ